MPESKNHIDKEQLRRYLSGEMTLSERHEFERQRLRSDFELEAMEGIETLDGTTFFSDLKELEHKLTKKSKRKIPFLGIAASLLLLFSVAFVIGWITLSDNNNAEEKSITKAEEIGPTDQNRLDTTLLREESTDTIDRSQPKTSEINEAISLLEEESEKEEKLTEGVFSNDKQEVESKKSSGQADAEAERAIVFAEEKDPVKDTPKEIITDSVQETLKLETDIAKSIASGQEVSKRELRNAKKQTENLNAALPSAAPVGISDKPMRTISGIVYNGDSGALLPGVTVTVKGSSEGTFTDINGRFTFDIPLSGNILQISYLGYNTEEIEVSGQSDIQVQLSPTVTALSEVVITGYGNKIHSLPSQIEPARPEGGIRGLNKYIRENLNYPEAAKENQISGKVIVVFRVGIEGDLFDFRIEKSLGYGCDEEAINIIRSGPKWYPRLVNGSPEVDEVKVTVKFQQ